MPGGLAAWLNDDTTLEYANSKGTETGGLHSKSMNTPRRHAAAMPLLPSRGLSSVEAAAGRHHPPSKRNKVVVDVEEVAYSKSVASKTSGASAVATTTVAESLWDPFLVKQDMTTPSKPNAFARLLQGASSGSKKSSKDSAQPNTPVSLVSAWDPFASGDGKENNAFSKMLAATPSTSNTSASRVKGVRSASTGKRKHPAAGLELSGGAAADADAGVMTAATRFCECPVCGKRVMIELCSKHIDTECGGPRTESPQPSLPRWTLGTSPHTAQESRISGTRCREALTAASMDAAASQRTANVSWPSFGMTECVIDDQAIARPKSCKQLHDDNGSRSLARNPESGDDCGGKKSVVELNNPAPASLPLPPVTLTHNLNALPSQSQKKRGSARDAISIKAASTATVSNTLTSCPVCGKRVRADLCSHHLDTQCTGVSSDAKEQLRQETRTGKEDRRQQSSAVPCGGASSPTAEEAGTTEQAKKSGEGDERNGETAGGLKALAAELTCPVCLCLFEEPHTLPCSHRFCLVCITDCFKSSKKQECPLCKVPAWRRDMKRDVPLQNIIQAYRRLAS